MTRINEQLSTIYKRVCDVSRRQKIKQNMSLDRDVSVMVLSTALLII